MTLLHRLSGILALTLLLAACTVSDTTDSTSDQTPAVTEADPAPEDITPNAVQTQSDQADPTPLPGNIDEVVFSVDNVEYVIRPILPKDGIMPIYDPQFTTPDEAHLDPEELVMGVEINGDARAYQVGVLRSREMVNDIVGGTPVLVTW